MRAEKSFLVLALIFGICMVFLTPPFQAPDEFLHFLRSFRVASGHFCASFAPKQDWLFPASLVQVMDRFQPFPFHPEIRVRLSDFQGLWTLSLQEPPTAAFPMGPYLFMPYVPQAIGIFFGKLLGLSPLVLLYLGRLSNLFFWVGLTYQAIKITPIFKWMFCLLALIPMSIFLAASLSYDTFTNGICFLWIALCLRYALGKEERIDTRQVITILSISLAVALSKHAYVLLALLFFLIPMKKFGSIKRYLLSLLSLLLLNGLTFFSWFFTVVLPKHAAVGSPAFEGKLSQIFHPISFTLTLLKNLQWQSIPLLQQFLGVLGWLDTPLPSFLYFYLCGLLLLVACYDHDDGIDLNRGKKLLLALTWIATTTLMLTAIFLAWKQDSSGLITGVQGRYFIPLSPLPFFMLYNRRLQPAMGERGLRGLVILGVLPSLLVTSWTLLHRYYLSWGV